MNDIEYLASRVRFGDPVASDELRRQLESKLTPIVRRTLRTRACHSSFTRRILAEAERLTGRVDRESFVSAVCQRMCEIVIGQIDPEHGPKRAALETVCH